MLWSEAELKFKKECYVSEAELKFKKECYGQRLRWNLKRNVMVRG
jgi:hypothetical protein